MPTPENVIANGFRANPQNIKRGRNKGSRNRSTLIKEWLECVAAEDGQEGDKADELARSLIRKAASGDVAAIKEAFDSAYGKIPDKVLTAETTPEELYNQQMAEEILRLLPDGVLDQLMVKYDAEKHGENILPPEETVIND